MMKRWLAHYPGVHPTRASLFWNKGRLPNQDLHWQNTDQGSIFCFCIQWGICSPFPLSVCSSVTGIAWFLWFETWLDTRCDGTPGLFQIWKWFNLITKLAKEALEMIWEFCDLCLSSICYPIGSFLKISSWHWLEPCDFLLALTFCWLVLRF